MIHNFSGNLKNYQKSRSICIKMLKRQKSQKNKLYKMAKSWNFLKIIKLKYINLTFFTKAINSVKIWNTYSSCPCVCCEEINRDMVMDKFSVEHPVYRGAV